ncbi:endoplasmin [Tanacetum coccineum]
MMYPSNSLKASHSNSIWTLHSEQVGKPPKISFGVKSFTSNDYHIRKSPIEAQTTSKVCPLKILSQRLHTTKSNHDHNSIKASPPRHETWDTNPTCSKWGGGMGCSLGPHRSGSKVQFCHFNAEGDVEFKVVLFVTPKAPTDLYESYYNANKSNLKLYVRRGLVDIDTVPLNASQEMLQQHNSLKTIKKKLIKKALDMIHKLVEDDPDEVHDKEKKESKADDAFSISEDTYNEPLGRGTEIRLHLSEEAGEYLQESKLKANKEVDVEVPADEDNSSNEKEKLEATKGEEKEE